MKIYETGENEVLISDERETSRFFLPRVRGTAADESGCYAVGGENTLVKLGNGGELSYHVSTVGETPVSVNCTGDFLYLCCADSDTLHLVDKASGNPLVSSKMGNCLVDFDIMGDHAVAASFFSGELIFAHKAILQPWKTVRLNIMPNNVCFDGEFLFCTGIDDSKAYLLVFDKKVRLLKKIEIFEQPIEFAVLNNYIAVLSSSGVLAFYDRGIPLFRGAMHIGDARLCRRKKIDELMFYRGNHLFCVDAITKVIRPAKEFDKPKQ